MIAQAHLEHLTIVTADGAFEDYDVEAARRAPMKLDGTEACNTLVPSSLSYQSNFTPKRAIVGPTMLTGRSNAEPLPQLMFWAASEFIRL